MDEREPLAGRQPLDDCWNRIGVRGDKSCPKLVEHVHCRNCPVYAAAAVRLLDRYALVREDQVEEEVADLASGAEVATRSLLIFRLGDEWLALATRVLVEVLPLAPIHALPHARSRVLLGVANVRGALVACLSLAELLGIDMASRVPAQRRRVVPRLLVLAAEGGHLLAPVDEVEGIYGIEVAAIEEATRRNTLTSPFSLGVLEWRDRSVRLLDVEQLLLAMTRSLT